MPLYDYLTPKLDFKRKFNHRQSFLYKGRLTMRGDCGRFENFESDHHYESNPESEVRFEIESNLEASQVPSRELLCCLVAVMASARNIASCPEGTEVTVLNPMFTTTQARNLLKCLRPELKPCHVSPVHIRFL